VEPTLRVIEHQGRIGKRTWIAAPIYELGSIPAASTDVDPETGVRVPLRDLIRRGKVFSGWYGEQDYNTDARYAERNVFPITLEPNESRAFLSPGSVSMWPRCADGKGKQK